MKRYIIDTNALISYVTDRNPEQQRKVAGIFQEAGQLRGVILCPQNVLTEFIFVLDKVYGVPKKEIQMMAKDFLAMPGIEMVHEIDFATVFNFWPEPILDFGDAIIASLASLYKGSIILTFDLKFFNTIKKLRLPVKTL